MYNTQEMDKIESAESKANRELETPNPHIAKEEDSMETCSDTDETDTSETEGYAEPKNMNDLKDAEELQETRRNRPGASAGTDKVPNRKVDYKNDKARNRPHTAIAREQKDKDHPEKSRLKANAVKKDTTKNTPTQKNAINKHLETNVDAIDDMVETVAAEEAEPLTPDNEDKNVRKVLKDGSKGKRSKERVRYADEDMKNISELLTQVKEDVVTGPDNPDSGVYIIEDNLYKAPSPYFSSNLNPTSHLEHRTFVQLKSGFIQSSYEKSNVLDFDEKELCRRSPHFSFALNSPLDIAIALQCGFQQMARVCHGLLGGVALFQLILVYFIESPDSSFRPPSLPLQSLHIFARHDNPSWQEDMQGGVPGGQFQPPRHLSIHSYASLAYVPPALTILLLLLCVVSVLDRFDISSNLSWSHLVHLVTFRKSVICVVLYLVSLLLSLVCYKYDEMFVYLADYPNDLSFPKSFKTNDLSVWKQLTTARCSLSLLSSILLTLSDPQDLLQHNLKAIKTYESAPSKPETNQST